MENNLYSFSLQSLNICKKYFLLTFLFLLGLSLANSTAGYAQICSGAKGDPVIINDFGHINVDNTNKGFGSALPSGTTGYTYWFPTTVPAVSPDALTDGRYSMMTSISTNNTGYSGWWDVPEDHTANGS